MAPVAVVALAVVAAAEALVVALVAALDLVSAVLASDLSIVSFPSEKNLLCLYVALRVRRVVLG